jgi:hypothetical protein
MTEPTATSTTTTTTAPSSAPSSTSAPASTSTPAQNSAPAVDRSRGHSPALDAREGQIPARAAADTYEIDGASYSSQELRDALSHRAEAELRRANMPKSAAEYKTELPKDFAPPAGMSFELDSGDPLLAHARTLAYQRGIDQETFSDMLGIYAANECAREQQLATARGAELQKLGAAGPQRIAQIETWLKAIAGNDAAPMIAQLKGFPVSSMVRMFESIISRHSNQGAVPFSQAGRVHEDNAGKIQNYENLTFSQRRVAQMSHMMSGRGEK